MTNGDMINGDIDVIYIITMCFSLQEILHHCVFVAYVDDGKVELANIFYKIIFLVE